MPMTDLTYPKGALSAGATRGVENGAGFAPSPRPDRRRPLGEASAMMQSREISLSNGLGLDFTDGDGGRRKPGVAANELISLRHRDWLADAPWHKHVPARLEAIA